VSSDDKPLEFVIAKEEDQISRKILKWLNTFPEIPLSIFRVDYEFMNAELECMALSLVQSTYIIERFIDDSYIAEYQFKIVYRVNPSTTILRLGADELLNALGDWASSQKPDIGDGLKVRELEQTARSSLFARMERGWEDHQIFMRMTYEVGT